MAHKEFCFPYARWRDPRWVALSQDAQWLFFVLCADPATNIAGITTLAIARWADYAADASDEAVEAALENLEDEKWVVVDRKRMWVWITTFMTDNRVFNQPNKLRGAVRTIRENDSSIIRDAAALQLAEWPDDLPGLVIGNTSRPERQPVAASRRLAVYERDDWTCRACGRRFSPWLPEHYSGQKAPYDESGWLELDHNHPWSKGGDSSMENLRSLCSPCNRIKAARVLVASGAEV